MNEMLDLYYKFKHGDVRSVCLQKCVLAYDKETREKKFPIYCDNKIGNMKYSFLRYQHATGKDKYYGQVAAIIVFTTLEDDKEIPHIGFLMNRLKEAKDNTKRQLPCNLYQYCLNGQVAQIDAISGRHVLSPIFACPALDMGMKMTSVGKANTGGKSAKTNNFFYVLDVDEIECNYVRTYDHYLLNKNTHVFGGSHKPNVDGRRNSNCFNYGAYLSVQDMQSLKEQLNVGGEIGEWDDELCIHRSSDEEDYVDYEQESEEED